MSVAREAESKAVNKDVSVLLWASSGKDFFTLVNTKYIIKQQDLHFIDYKTRKN